VIFLGTYPRMYCKEHVTKLGVAVVKIT